MSLGDVLKAAATKDLAGGKKLTFTGMHKPNLSYSEEVNDGMFKVKLVATDDPDLYVECSMPDDGTEETQNYCRLYFLSMAFNAAIHGMKRQKQTKPPNEQKDALQ